MSAFPPCSDPTAIVCPSEQKEIQLSCSPVIICLTSLHSTMSKKCIFSSRPTEHISRLLTGLNAIPVQEALCAKNFCFIALLWRSHSATIPLSNEVAKVRQLVGLNRHFVIGDLICRSVNTTSPSRRLLTTSWPSADPEAIKLSFELIDIELQEQFLSWSLNIWSTLFSAGLIVPVVESSAEYAISFELVLNQISVTVVPFCTTCKLEMIVPSLPE